MDIHIKADVKQGSDVLTVERVCNKIMPVTSAALAPDLVRPLL